jgi:hypothetical protein
MPSPPIPPATPASAEPAIAAGARRTETADDPDSLRNEVAALREQLRALEQRLEQKRG